MATNNFNHCMTFQHLTNQRINPILHDSIQMRSHQVRTPQIQTTNNQLQKKRNSSHIPAANQPPKRRKLNQIFNQNRISDYKNYLNFILEIIQMAMQNHNSMKMKHNNFLGIKNLQKNQQIMTKALRQDPSLHYPVLMKTIKKIIRHVPMKYQEQIANKYNHKFLFDKYIKGRDENHLLFPFILDSVHTYYEYTGGIIIERHCKNKKNVSKKQQKKQKKQKNFSKLTQTGQQNLMDTLNEKRRLQYELKDMDRKYEQLLWTVSQQNKRIEQLQKDKLTQNAIIDGLNACINEEKNSNLTINTLKNVLKQLNEKHVKITREKEELQKENIALMKENFELFNQLKEKVKCLNENSNNMNDIRIKEEPNVELDSNSNNGIVSERGDIIDDDVIVKNKTLI